MSRTSAILDFGNQSGLAGTLNMTVGFWANPSSILSNNVVVAFGDFDANSGLRGWAFSRDSSQMRFSKLGVIDINNNINGSYAIGTLRYYAAVVSATQVRFIRVATDGTLSATTSNNSSAFNNTGADRFVIGARPNGASGFTSGPFAGTISDVSVWIGAQLTDAAVVAAALGGPYKCGYKPTLFVPDWGVASPEPDVAAGAAGTATTAGTLGLQALSACPFPV